jgi:hypothetical protein
MRQLFVRLSSEDGQDIAEYAVMVAVILLIVFSGCEFHHVSCSNSEQQRITT